MKTKTISTDKATLIVAELPEGSHSVRLCKHIRDGIHYLSYDGATNTAYKEFLPDGSWQLIGRLPDITEEQSSKVVPTMPIQKGKTKRYIAAKEAMHSLLQANEVYFENRLSEEPDISASSYTDMFTIAKQSRKHLQWELEQAKVWDKERTYLFIKVD